MEITVLFFARARDVTEVQSIQLLFEQHSVTSDCVLKAVVDRHPKLESVLKSCVLAINQVYADKLPNQEIKDGDEVAIIPPLSGG
jgi:molybdopterin synthase sulfur carrier subunit